MKQVRVRPNPDRDLEIGIDDKFCPEKVPTGKTKELKEVPSYFVALLRMLDGSWLSINDDEEHDANRLFIGGNLNLSLICALLFTTFLPLYYSEAQRLNDSSDGLTIDVTMGYLAPLVISKDFLHDAWDCAYLVGGAGTLFGTMVSVFYMLAANEANDDAKTFVLLRYLGPKITQLPFYFFNIGIYGWAFGVLLHIFAVPRHATGFYVKIIILATMILFMILVCFPRIVQGIFLGKKESQLHPPLYVPKEKILQQVNEFFKDPYSNGNLSLPNFLKSLTYMTESGFRPKLQIISQIQATHCYYQKLAEISDVAMSDVKEALATFS